MQGTEYYAPGMCGIAGIIALDGSAVDPMALDRLTDALTHRGPDGRGAFIAGNVGLGSRRLAVLDRTPASDQPMISEDGTVALVFNGEIYNVAQERSELEAKGYRFRSKGDAEVLLNLYREYGDHCIDHLRGMFAFAIHDRKKECVLLVRDRVGKKPLKYFMKDGVFAFASELKALQTMVQCPKGIDDEAIHHFLTMMYVPSPQTGIAGIHKLPAAHLMKIDLKTGQQDIRRYWSVTYTSDQSVSLPEWKEKILTTLKESVALRMTADVPVGAFLSGGIDSATVVALMSQCSDRPIETFSIGSPEQTHNELPDARRIAEVFGTRHHPIVVEPDIPSLLTQIVHTYEEPFADPSSIPTYLLSQETKKFVTVALGGDGGDENFAGYVRYPILRFSEQWGRLPIHGLMRPALREFHALAQNTFSERALRFEQTLGQPWPERYLEYLSFFPEAEKRRLYCPGFAFGFPTTSQWFSQQTEVARGRGDTLLHRAMSMDLSTYLADDLLPKMDLGSMAHGLEVRSPFLDHQLLELTAQLPESYQLRGRQGKWILKQIMKDILPAETLHKKKAGFRLPLDRWFRTEHRAFVMDRILAESSPLSGIFDRPALETFLASYFSSRIDQSDCVWMLLFLDEWMRQYTS